MTKDEALRLALEAWQTSCYGSEIHHKAMLLAMTKIGQAIEQAEKQEPVAWVEPEFWSYLERSNCGTAYRLPDGKREPLYTTPQQRKPLTDEPVAWRDAAIRLGEELSSVGPDGYYDMDAKEWLDWAMKQNPRGNHSLPQRTWAGLTIDEREQIQQECFGKVPHHVAFAHAIEAKLKEKNT